MSSGSREAAESARESPEVYTAAEAAVILRVRQSWLERRAAGRQIPFTMLGGAYHFTAEHIAEIVRMNEQRPVMARDPEIGHRKTQRRQGAEAARTLRPRPRPQGPRHKPTAA
jgi:hypothetical protein